MTAVPDRSETQASLRRPREGTGLAALAALVLLALAAWAALLLQAVRAQGEEGTWIDVICRPALSTAGGGLWTAWAATAGLWMLMSTAMMLPTAVPMLASYTDAADRRRRETGQGAPSLMLVAAGYLAIWLAVSAFAALVQVGAAQLGTGIVLPPRLGGILAGVAVGIAGLYQFSEWKLACLTFCRHDVPAEAAASGAAGALRAGLVQGLRCLGCCGAVMAMMLVAGFMNVFWMAGFALLMTAEKLSDGLVLPRAIGAGLVALGLVLAVQAVGPAAVLAWMAR